MDDVLSELDPARQQAVLQSASRAGQTLLTVTSTDVLERSGVGPMPIVLVADGELRPVHGNVASI